jgi:hypothetical protein
LDHGARPVVVAGRLVRGAVDGLAAARFLQQVKRWLEAVDESLPLF